MYTNKMAQSLKLRSNLAQWLLARPHGSIAIIMILIALQWSVSANNIHDQYINQQSRYHSGSRQSSFASGVANKQYPFSSSLQQQQQQLSPVNGQQAPIIEHFSFNSNVQENQRQSLQCTVSSGESPLKLVWFKDGQLLSKELAQANGIKINLVADYSSTILFQSMRLEHSGNYTCQAQNKVGTIAHSTQLVVHGEPRWLKEPQHESITLRGQTVVVDCQTIGYPKPTQTWLFSKSHTEYEPIVANDRLQIATNGSLIIKHADKNDEANYLCKSVNGIGQGLSATTKLRVNVPAHFKSKSSSIVVRKQTDIQLRCDVIGDAPITIEWFKNKQRLQLDSEQRYLKHETPTPSGQISLLIIKQAQRQDNSIYECRTHNLVGNDELLIDLAVQEEPDSIQEIQATQIGSRSITIAWTVPYDGKSPISSYLFQYKEIVEPITNDPLSIDTYSPQQPAIDDWQNAQSVVVNANHSNSCTIDKLDPSTKYIIRALATNAIGKSKFSHPMEFITDEEAPRSGPTFIQSTALNSTSIHVAWQEVPKSKQLGRISGYYIGHKVANTSQSYLWNSFIINELLVGQQQHESVANGEYQTFNPTQQKMGRRLDTVITDLKRDTTYEITVVAFNSQGSGPSSEYVLCKTNEMDPPKPVKIQIKRHTNESIFVEWQRDPTDQNPVDDYVLFQEKNSASQEWLQIRLPGNQTQYKAPGLKCGTRYQFYIIAYNKVGKSAQSDVVSASTSGALPVVPSKMSLIKMVNSTCLSINLNSFQDSGCRIRNVALRYRIEKTSSDGINSNNPTQAQSKNAALSAQSLDWITIRQKSKPFQNQEDRIEYLCNLSPTGEYTIHASAGNDVGRSEIEHSVVMSSDEWRQATLMQVISENIDGWFNIPLSYLVSRVSPVLTVVVAILLVSFIFLLAFVISMKFYKYLSEAIKIKIAQRRAARRVKKEAARNSINNSNVNGGTDIDDGNQDDEDDEDEFGMNSNSIDAGHYLSNLANSGFETSSTDSREAGYGTMRGLQKKRKQQQQLRRQQMRKCASAGATLSNRYNMKTNLSLNDAAFIIGSSPDLIKIQNDSNNRLKKQQAKNCNHKISSASSASTDICSSGLFMSSSTESIPKFQYLSGKRETCVKMNEYTPLPYDYRQQQQQHIQHQHHQQLQQAQDIYRPMASNLEPSYYSTLRRTSMQSYVPDNHHRHNETAADIYGYHHYMATDDEANQANSILVPPQNNPSQYSSPPSISSVSATAANLGYHHLPPVIPSVMTGTQHIEPTYGTYTTTTSALNNSNQSHYLAMDMRTNGPNQMLHPSVACSRSPSMNHSNYSSPRIHYADKPAQAYL